jgi:hypothetical protein
MGKYHFLMKIEQQWKMLLNSGKTPTELSLELMLNYCKSDLKRCADVWMQIYTRQLISFNLLKLYVEILLSYRMPQMVVDVIQHTSQNGTEIPKVYKAELLSQFKKDNYKETEQLERMWRHASSVAEQKLLVHFADNIQRLHSMQVEITARRMAYMRQRKAQIRLQAGKYNV